MKEVKSFPVAIVIQIRPLTPFYFRGKLVNYILPTFAFNHNRVRQKGRQIPGDRRALVRFIAVTDNNPFSLPLISAC